MRIVDVRTVLLTGPSTNDPYLGRTRRSAAFIEILTDTELTGLGETSPALRERYPFVPGSGELNPAPGKPLTDVGYPGLERQAPTVPPQSPEDRH